MKTFITSDHHFGHTNIIKLCNRPFSSIEEMDAEMVRRWNLLVDKDDLVYHLGDLFWTEKAAKEILPQLNGVIHLILGNHDKNWKRVYSRLHFPNLIVHPEQILEIKTPLRAVLCHYPLLSWNGVFYKIKHFHGHTHRGCPGEGLRYNVSVENTDYFPVNLESFME